METKQSKVIPDILIIGGGVFGVTAALELRARGYSVSLVDPGPLPHPLAASTDISKVVRMEYGPDVQYMAMVEESISGFLGWNEAIGDEVYHNTGVTMFIQNPMAAGGYEFESFQALIKRGHRPERVAGRALQERFPAWSESYVDGFFNPEGGYVESGRLMSGLVRLAEAQGVSLIRGTAEQVSGGQVTLSDGRVFSSGLTIVAAGAWTSYLVPAVSPYMKSTGHPVFHLRPSNPAAFTAPDFCTFTADVSRTGWYGFPFNPREGVVKVANHGVGIAVHPENDPREVYPADHAALRSFLAATFPSLADAEVVYTRRCLYSDTLDEHLWIDFHPEDDRLLVAAGGSGHGMKFAPVLGPLIADALERRPNPWLERFAWRHLAPDMRGEEPARHHAK
ncbi:MAG: glycine/D-amino acid oxidase-like deaminating enzyme [Rhodothermales bacterium]